MRITLPSISSSSSSRPTPLTTILFLDDIDVLCAHRASETTSAHDSRVVAQLLTLMDGVRQKDKDTNAAPVGEARPPGAMHAKAASYQHRVLVVAATSHPNSIDPALRRWGCPFSTRKLYMFCLF